MQSIAHIINPVIVPETSDLYIAQPITLETMRTARNFCAGLIEVSLFTAQFPEDRPLVPEDFKLTPDLKRSVLDFGSFTIPRKLPLIKDILDRLYENSSAEFLVYTNADIALQPYFYMSVSKIIEQGYDAFIINRRTLPSTYKRVDEIPLMNADLGGQHPGWDCYVFHRSLYPRFVLGTACIGAGWFARTPITNLSCLAKRFHIFTDLHLTFHLGNDQVWKKDQFAEFRRHNQLECKKVLLHFEDKLGPLDRTTIPGRFLSTLEREVLKAARPGQSRILQRMTALARSLLRRK
jgi:hypothetical protein